MTADLKVEDLYQFLKVESIEHMDALPLTCRSIVTEFSVSARTASWIMYFRGSKHWDIDIEDKLIEMDHRFLDNFVLDKAKLVDLLLVPLTEDYLDSKKDAPRR